MIKPILIAPDWRLNIVSEEITSFDTSIIELKQDLEDTLGKTKNGIGLAAPQIGVNLRAILVDTVMGTKERVFMANPVILAEMGEEANFNEGCLSVPKLRVKRNRHAFITVRYQDEFGVHHTLSTGGLMSICIQHEIDHLNGILIS